MSSLQRSAPAPHRLPIVEPRRIAMLIGALYVALALAFGLVNPLFEAPDEHWHYFTAQTIADEWRLPRVSEPPDPWLGQEAAQPPLYYMLGALIVAPVPAEGARELVWPNPHVRLGDASDVNNINAFIHGPWEAWPFRGYALAAHLLRLFSTLLGLGTLYFIFGSARQLWPDRPRRALLAMALVAFLPQFLFIHSAVTNDALITFLCAAAIWQLIRLWRSPPRAVSLMLLGLTIGLAILSKTAGLLLLAYACGVLLLKAFWHRQSLWRMVLRITSYVVIPALLTGGWVLLRNWNLYGDVTAANQFIAIAGGDRAATLRDVLAETGSLWTSFIAVFGWFNVRAPDWVYWFWNALVLAAAAGWLWALVSRRWRAVHELPLQKDDRDPQREPAVVALWLAAWLVLVYGGLLAFMLRTPAAQGRLLFPALAPLALGLAYGLDRFGGLRNAWPLMALMTSLYCLLVVIPTAYEKPALLATSTMPSAATSVDVELNSGLQLLGYQVQTPQLAPGDVARMTVYWRTSEPQPAPPAAPQLVVELFGYDDALVGKFQGYHGRGLYPATLWPQGTIIAEELAIPLTHTLQAPSEVRVQVGLASTAERLTLTALEVEPETWPEAPATGLARLGDSIQLVQATMASGEAGPGDELIVTLGWHVLQDIATSYTTFVHLGEPTELPLAQGDGPPLSGYYPTWRWEAGEVIARDKYIVEIPQSLASGRYPLWIGLYDAKSGQRLPLFAGGERQANDAFLVGWVEIR